MKGRHTVLATLLGACLVSACASVPAPLPAPAPAPAAAAAAAPEPATPAADEIGRASCRERVSSPV